MNKFPVRVDDLVLVTRWGQRELLTMAITQWDSRERSGYGYVVGIVYGDKPTASSMLIFEEEVLGYLLSAEAADGLKFQAGSFGQ